MGALHNFFGGKDIHQIKNGLSELYQNFSFATLSGARNFNFDAVSHLIARVSFLIKGSTLMNRKRQDIEDMEQVIEINDKTSFVPKTTDPFQELVHDLFNHKNTAHSYVEPQVQTDPEIETETQAGNYECNRLKQEFGNLNDAATEQKKQNDAIDLVDDILDEDNPFKNIGTEDIWIEDDLFDDDDNQTVKGISKDIIDTTNDVINDTIQTDFSTVTTEEPTFPTITTLEDDFPTIIDDCDDSIQTIIIDDVIQILNEDGVATDTGVPKKVKIISSNTNRIKSGADKILNKYKKQKPIGTLKAKTKKSNQLVKTSRLAKH